MSEARIIAGSGCPELARSVAVQLRSTLVECELDRFPDGELRPVLGTVRGDDVYVLSSTGPPVDGHLVELLLFLDAARRGGAARITAVVPYFGYARQDRRNRPGEPIGVRLVAEVIATAGAERLVVVDPHSRSFETACSLPVETLSARRPLLDALMAKGSGYEVVVAPDLGAIQLAEEVAGVLELPVVFVRKHRISGAAVKADELVGVVDGRRALVVDDMIATGATIEAAAGLLRTHGVLGLGVLATHGLFVGGAGARLGYLGLADLFITDSLPLPVDAAGEWKVCTIAPLLAEAIGRLHREERLDDLGRFG